MKGLVYKKTEVQTVATETVAFQQIVASRDSRGYVS